MPLKNRCVKLIGTAIQNPSRPLLGTLIPLLDELTPLSNAVALLCTDYKCWRCDKSISVFRRRYQFEHSLYAHLLEPETYGYCYECRLAVEREDQENRAQ